MDKEGATVALLGLGGCYLLSPYMPSPVPPADAQPLSLKLCKLAHLLAGSIDVEPSRNPDFSSPIPAALRRCTQDRETRATTLKNDVSEA